MTCIVALVDNEITYFAGDAFVGNVPTQYNSNAVRIIRKEPKVWARDGMVFGANGAVRMLQLLRYQMEIPEYIRGQNKIAYLVTKFIPALQDCFEANKYENEQIDGNILLSLDNEIFTIGKHFNVCDTSNGYDSVGKAYEVALGSLHTTGALDLLPLRRLYFALKAAERHTCVVSEPFTYVTSEMQEAEILTRLTEIL